jgi:hypothetical protein
VNPVTADLSDNGAMVTRPRSPIAAAAVPQMFG